MTRSVSDNRLELPQTKPIPWKSGDSLRWDFDFDMPSGLGPGILFLQQGGEVPQHPFGPFTMLSHSIGPRHSIIASGFSGHTEDLQYQVGLFSAGRDHIQSPSAERTLRFEPHGHLPVVTREVRISLQVAGDPPNISLKVEPENLTIVRGTPVVWEFVIPTDVFDVGTWFPEILFRAPPDLGPFDPGPSATPPPLGPFKRFSTVAGPIADATAKTQTKILASGVNSEVKSGIFHYICRIRNEDKVLAISSSDPTIDDEGELMTPPTI